MSGNGHTKVRLLASITLDGFIARSKSDIPYAHTEDRWQSPAAEREFLKEVQAADIVVCGRSAMSYGPPIDKPVMILSRQSFSEICEGDLMDWVVEPHFGEVRDWIDAHAGKNILVFGGAHTFDFFLRWNLVDEMVLLQEPLMLGSGVRLRAQPETRGGQDLCRFTITGCRVVDGKGTIRTDFRRARP